LEVCPRCHLPAAVKSGNRLRCGACGYVTIIKSNQMNRVNIKRSTVKQNYVIQCPNCGYDKIFLGKTMGRKIVTCPYCRVKIEIVYTV
jgi:DNA-directed RNA polymerase subunit RPC12/RpoP